MNGHSQSDISDGAIRCESSPSHGSRRLTSYVLTAVLFIVLPLVAVINSRAARFALFGPAEKVVLSVSPAKLSLGEVPVSKAFSCTIPIANYSRRTVTIAELRASCGCTSVSPRRCVIAPGQTQDIHLTVDLLQATGYGQGLRLPFEIRLQARINNGGPSYPSWTVSGTALYPCAFEADQVAFFGAKSLTRGAVPVRQDLRGTLADSEYTIFAHQRPLDGAVEISRPDERGEFTVTIIPSKDWPVGRFEYPVSLYVRDRDGDVIFTRSIQVYGNVVPSLKFAPDVLLLGSRPVDVPITVDVTLNCPPGKVIDLVSDWENVKVSLRESTEADLSTVRLTITPDSHGPGILSIAATSLDARDDFTTTSLPIYLHGVNGLQP